MVVWDEMSKSMRAAVISHAEVPFGGGKKPIIPDHKIYFAPFKDEAKAHYICALLNSKPIKEFVNSFTIKIQVGTLFRHITLKKFDPLNKNHQVLVKLSKECHDMQKQKEGKATLDANLKKINSIVERIFFIKSV